MAAVPIVRQLGLSSRGVISVDPFGHLSDYDVIAARENNRWLISAAAQAFGAAYHGRKVGTVGDVISTSFFPDKCLHRYGQEDAVFAGADKTAHVTNRRFAASERLAATVLSVPRHPYLLIKDQLALTTCLGASA
jgi:hypothetical protein